MQWNKSKFSKMLTIKMRLLKIACHQYTQHGIALLSEREYERVTWVTRFAKEFIVHLCTTKSHTAVASICEWLCVWYALARWFASCFVYYLPIPSLVPHAPNMKGVSSELQCRNTTASTVRYLIPWRDDPMHEGAWAEPPSRCSSV